MSIAVINMASVLLWAPVTVRLQFTLLCIS